MAKFTMLVGLPASGKTTIAPQLAKLVVGANPKILSSDGIREELYGDAAAQDNPARVFDLMRDRTISALKGGINVVYDATNLSRKRRKALLSQLPSCEKTAIIVWAKYGVCAYRDAKRERGVGDAVLRRMSEQFQPPYYDEGWDHIYIIHTSDLYTREDWDSWMKCEHDNPHHQNTVGEHTQNVVRVFQNYCFSHPIRSFRFTNVLYHAIMLHDSGKAMTKTYENFRGDVSDKAHYYNHQHIGSYLSLGFAPILLQHSNLGSLRETPITPHPQQDIRELLLLSWLIDCHMDPFLNTKYYRALKDCPEKCLLDILHKCDVEGA